MGELLPTLAAESIRAGLLDYLRTTFALADQQAARAVEEFLDDPDAGIFKGPYVRLRLPFQAAEDGWRRAVDWHPRDDGQGFPPYGHQALALARLSSLPRLGAEAGPRPTLITTGTGSGKTEAFLYPILDHVLRANRAGIAGTKALILYPMNALAHDQAGRIAELITSSATLRGHVTAGIYTGIDGPQRTRVSAEGLISDRYALRSSPPDILLTNYKMLDQLLLRRDDARLWEQAATALRYLVLDEFHTYDGAQGTDVAMLLRRLGVTLKAHGAAGKDALAGVTPVATSATLGDQTKSDEMLRFAETVFGVPFEADAVITESRIPADDWLPADPAWGEPSTGEPLMNAITAALDALGADPDPAELARGVADAMYVSAPADATLADRTRHHPVTATLLHRAGDAVPLAELAGAVFGVAARTAPAKAIRATAAILGLLSHVRRAERAAWPSLEAHLWVRELTRIDREATAAPAFRWGDDGPLAAGAAGDDTLAPTAAFPAIYCRHCGRSGWGVMLSPASDGDLAPADANIRKESAAGASKFRALIAEGDRTTAPLPGEGGDLISHARWFHPVERRLLASPPEGDDGGEVTALRVVVHTGADAGDRSRSDTCPACGQRDGIRFLGSSVATQLSVALSTLFGIPQLDADEKKTLIFTDSVQDAAHRAGFIQARSRSLTLRAMITEAIGDREIRLDQLGPRIIEKAGDDPARRYRVLPPDLAEHERFKAFWETATLDKVERRVRGRVEQRAAFDATLEVGLNARLGRTLELTGTIAVEVDATSAQLQAAAREALLEGNHDAGLVPGGEERLIAWARGMLERMRTSGAIRHPWLEKLIENDGNRYFIWRGRARHDGMPAFPRGRSAPAFPRVGPPPTGKRDNFVLDQVTSSQGWYADWTARSLNLPSKQGATFARLLLAQLARIDVITAISNPAGAIVYAIEPRNVIIHPLAERAVSTLDHRLVCDTCAAEQVGGRDAIHQLAMGPCVRPRCPGRLSREAGDPHDFYRRFYRSRDARRVVAREHTSLLDDRERTAFEAGFRDGAMHPGAPNVLVATPTLEMGIDIGELSTVMLASLPRHVASYLQRVGRAGRRTGSALDLAFVPGKRQQLPQLSSPLGIINGAVRPPATYLDAEELLRRQFVAALADAEARDPQGVRPSRARDVLASFADDSYLGALARRAEQHPELLEEFLAGFAGLSDPTRDALRRWVAPSDPQVRDTMAHRFADAVAAYQAQRELLQFRAKEIERALPELRAIAEREIATDDEKFAYRSAIGGIGLVRRQLGELEGTGKEGGFWVSALEHAGIFPNYTLRDDAVELDVGLSWQDPETLQYESQVYTLGRGASVALREFSPGATFYSRGHQLKVDSVDLGHAGEAARLWALCAACGYEHDIEDGQRAPTLCPRCESPSIADVSQQLRIVELRRVSSSMRRDDAIIDDSRDQREQERFEVLTSADYEPEQVRREWFADGLGFGVRHVGRITVRWLNLGRANGTGAPRAIAGQERPAELFRLCSECGHRDGTTGSNSKYDHRPWCSKREAAEESSITVALSHHLQTEGVLVEIPPYVALGSAFALPSLAAALMLGLREHFGGAPDHLALATVRDPATASGGDPQDALLLHDTVPGGTGYLADLADDTVMRRVLEGAYDAIRRCECASGDRIACHRCLLAFAPWGQDQWVSRAEAERQLRTLLGGGDEPDSDLTPWTITTTPPERVHFESRLEQRFRRAFRERLRALGYAIQEYPSERGDRWVITASRGRRWTLEPQLLVGRARPDFVLHSEDRAVPDVAIFCDGERYHAGRAVNRLADDAEKRAELRTQGLVVVAVTWGDLDDEEATPPPWFSDSVAQVLTASGRLDLRAAHLATMRSGPLDLLSAWVQHPAREDLERVGAAVPFFIVATKRASAALPVSQPLDAVAADVLRRGADALAVEPAGESEPSTEVWAWWSGSLAVACRKVGGSADDLEIAVILDDSPAAIAAENSAAWLEWLRLSTLLGARLGPTTIGVRSAVAGAAEPTSHDAEAASPAGAANDARNGGSSLPEAPEVSLTDALDGDAPSELAPAWAALIASATAEERELVLALAEHDAPVPEYGPEVDGIPLGLAWVDQQVTVDDAAFTDEDRAEIRRAGWRIVEPTAERIAAALQGGS